MGLLDGLDGSSEKTMGLLSAAINMLQASGPSPVKRSLSQIAAGGLLGGAQGFYGAKEAAAETELRKLKMKGLDMGLQKDVLEMDKYRGDIEKQKRTQDMQANILKMFTGGGEAPGTQAMSAGARAGDVGPTLTNAARQEQMPQSAPQRGGFPFDFNQVAALKIAGGPDMLDLYKYANDPLKLEQGATYKDRVTGQERSMPKLDNGMQFANGQVG